MSNRKGFVWKIALVFLALAFPFLHATTSATAEEKSQPQEFIGVEILPNGNKFGTEVLPSEVTVRPGSYIQFTALTHGPEGFSSSPPRQITKWSATGGVIDNAGLYEAGQIPGEYRVKARGLTQTGIATVKIVRPKRRLSRIEIDPDYKRLDNNEVTWFNVTKALAEDGGFMSIRPKWELKPPCAADIKYLDENHYAIRFVNRTSAPGEHKNCLTVVDQDSPDSDVKGTATIYVNALEQSSP